MLIVLVDRSSRCLTFCIILIAHLQGGLELLAQGRQGQLVLVVEAREARELDLQVIRDLPEPEQVQLDTPGQQDLRDIQGQLALWVPLLRLLVPQGIPVPPV